MPLVGFEAPGGLARRFAPKAGGDGIERILEVCPCRARIGAGCREHPGLALPAGDRRLSGLDLVRAHAVEEVIPGVVLADMIEAQPAPSARAVEIARRQRRAE